MFSSYDVNRIPPPPGTTSHTFQDADFPALSGSLVSSVTTGAVVGNPSNGTWPATLPQLAPLASGNPGIVRATGYLQAPPPENKVGVTLQGILNGSGRFSASACLYLVINV
jgi:hypothetical protein